MAEHEQELESKQESVLRWRMKFDFCKDCLTDEERAVLALRKRGWRNAEIAAELHCSERTVNRRVRKLKDKGI